MDFLSALRLSLCVICVSGIQSAKAAPADVRLDFAYAGNAIKNPSESCDVIFMKPAGSSWELISTIKGDGWKDLFSNDDLERLAYCFDDKATADRDAIRVNVFTTFGASRSGSGMGTEHWRDFSRPEKCAILGTRSINSSGYSRTYPRDRETYFACNSKFKGDIGFSLRYTDDTPWLDVKAVIAAMSTSELIDRIKAKHSAHIQEQMTMPLTGWLQLYGKWASREQLKAVANKVVEQDAAELFAKYADASLADEVVSQAKAFWMDRYRARWATLKHNSDDIGAMRKYAAMKPYVEGQRSFSSTDFDGVAPMAEKMAQEYEKAESDRAKKVAKEQETNARRLAMEEAQREKALAAQLAKWRSSLRIGDDTFCGPVIEVKQPMVKVAVRPQLSGFGNEAWLKVNEVFPTTVGCRNTNGRLTPN